MRKPRAADLIEMSDAELEALVRDLRTRRRDLGYSVGFYYQRLDGLTERDPAELGARQLLVTAMAQYRDCDRHLAAAAQLLWARSVARRGAWIDSAEPTET